MRPPARTSPARPPADTRTEPAVTRTEPADTRTEPAVTRTEPAGRPAEPAPGPAVARSAPLARYVPVADGPLTFRPGLHRFGTDFGNGAADRRYFQLDHQAPQYLEAKRQRIELPGRFAWLRDEAAEAALAAVADFAERERGHRSQGPPASRLWALSLRVQEDFVVVDGAQDRVLLVSVCIPGGWYPERILGASFRAVHQNVPDFADTDKASAAMLHAMCQRGPYVRFVWSIVTDGRLDHHPAYAPRTPFVAPSATGSVGAEDEAYLRVERQVTVPFPAHNASLFLIRTYVYPASTLTPDERRRIARAVSESSPRVAAYKGFTGQESEIRRRLGVG